MKAATLARRLAAMQAYVERCRAAQGFARQQRVIERVLAHREAHAKFLNTLSRLEYVGVRKMLKARHSDVMDLDGLQHILEEAVHAVRLKKFASALAGDAGWVRTFEASCTLAGDAAEKYFQTLDAAAASALHQRTSDVCYWLTSTLIEVRAATFYPAYQTALQRSGVGISVASLVQDEAGHLAQMGAALPRHIPGWRGVFEALLGVEERAFCTFMDAVEAVLDGMGSATPAALTA